MKTSSYLERLIESMFSEKYQAIALIIVFGITGNICFLASFFNSDHFIIAILCYVIVLCGFFEYKKVRRNENKKK